ncbi:unnamed protein product, partial [Didymodactylos carnosus]
MFNRNSSCQLQHAKMGSCLALQEMAVKCEKAKVKVLNWIKFFNCRKRVSRIVRMNFSFDGPKTMPTGFLDKSSLKTIRSMILPKLKKGVIDVQIKSGYVSRQKIVKAGGRKERDTIYDLGTGCVGASGYDNRTGETVTLRPGITYTVQITSQLYSQVYFSLSIDFNDDGGFDTQSETLLKNVSLSNVIVNNLTLIIPSSVRLGRHFMRAKIYLSNGSCNVQYGEIHDYT